MVQAVPQRTGQKYPEEAAIGPLLKGGKNNSCTGWKYRLCAYSVTQSCAALCDPMDCSPQDSSVHGIFQARILEWVAISSSRVSSQPRD